MKKVSLFWLAFFPFLAQGTQNVHFSTQAQRVPKIHFSTQIHPNPSVFGQRTRFILTADASIGQLSFPQISTPHISLHFISKTSQARYINGESTRTTSWIFLLQTDQPGDFTVPKFDVTYNGETYSIRATPFTVRPDPSATAASPRSSSLQNASIPSSEPLSDLQLIVSGNLPKKWYVGQCCPAVVQLLSGANVRGQLTSFPHKIGDKFSASKLMDDPKKDTLTHNGQPYGSLTWPTLLTALQSGNTSLSFSINMEVEKQTRRNTLFEDEDDDPFTAIKKGLGMVQTEPQILKSKSSLWEILPLPLPQPKEFPQTQAIGQFHLSSPKTLETEFIQHEPITLTFDVMGSGNFEAIQAPKLICDDQQWRTYEPKKHFEAKDSLGFEGTLHFTYTLVPLKDGNILLPSISFCFFHPFKEQYETLTSETKTLPVKLAIRQNSQPVSSVVTPTATPTAETPSTTVSSNEPSIQERTILMEPITWISSFSLFWWVQSILAMVSLIGFVRYHQTHTKDYAAHQASKQKQKTLQNALQEAFRKKEGVAFYTAAHELLEWKLQQRGSSLATVLQDPKLSEELKTSLQTFEQTYQASRFGQMSIECPSSLKETQQLLQSLS